MGRPTDQECLAWNRIVGERISRRRYERGLTQQSLADSAGIWRQTLANYENGNSCPTSHILYRIAKALACDIGFFYTSVRWDDHLKF